MPPWRIQHEPHTCSEQSLRIQMWNASCVQNTSIKPDRKGMMTRSEKIRNGSLLTDCEDRTGSEVTSNGKLRVWVWFDTVWKKNRQGGSRVSHVPLLKMEMIKQEHQGDQPRLPPSCIASLACVCMMAACPLLEMKWNNADKNQRSLTSFPLSEVKWRRTR